ncbi:hypothetical protein C0989_002470 [Termitomyces sp. Mn162]|nr:hypothetical protein C0989_002470 [Termitomyces sp. Mn162]
MARISVPFVLSALAVMASAAPVSVQLQKRIAQTIADSTSDWEQACLTAGGGQKCNPISQVAFTSLLAAGKNCDQQDAADQMIDLAKTLNNDPEMIRLTQIFVQQPRNAPDSLQVPYCQVAPKNAELEGLFHCQFSSSDFTKFSGDQTGNVPLGLSAVNPPGSCPAKPDGPVPDGVQLNTLVTNPVANGNAPGAAGASSAAAPPVSSAVAPSVPAAASPSAPASTAALAASGGFQLQNGQDAIAQNNQFAGLTPTSACTDGQEACVNGGFAQCVGGKFVITQCAGGTTCAALPLVNKPGTSITCTTPADRDARIAATGATSAGASSVAAPPVPSAAVPSVPAAASAPASTAALAASGGFQLQNGQDAIAQNNQFAGLTPTSACTDGQQACVNGGFAQCVGGKFVITQCAGGTTCAALPLVNKPGTSIACTTAADRDARIAATGATSA